MRQKILLTANEYARLQDNLPTKENVTPSAPPEADEPSAPPAPPSHLDANNGGYGDMSSKLSSNNVVPSAPSADLSPPVETFKSNECVICLENKVGFSLKHTVIKILIQLRI